MTNEQDNRIEAYLDGQLPARERAAFEADVEADPGLRQALRLHQLANEAIAQHGQAQLRQTMDGIRQRTGPLPAATLTFADRIRFFFYAVAGSPRKTAILGITAFTLVALASLLWIRNASDLDVRKHIIPPSIATQAGHAPEGTTPPATDVETEVLAMENLLAQARASYQAARTDDLRQLAQTDGARAVAHYFLAHRLLADGDFEAAAATFEAALADRPMLEGIGDLRDMGKLRFNLLLARLGHQRDKADALRAIAALRQAPDARGRTVQDHLKALEEDLRRNPVARWLGR